MALAAALALLAAGPAAGDCGQPLRTEYIPLPVWSTLPNEGDTWGVMPVFLRVCPDGQRTESILAPSVTWNSVIHYTGTFRWYYYPTDDSALTVIASGSTRINFNGLVMWKKLPLEAGAWTDELTIRAQRSAFYRFFGLGPDTPPEAQSSYTGLRLYAVARRGLNLASNLNLGATLGVEHDGVLDEGVPGLPLSPQAFPGAPGMNGATLLWQGLGLRYDDRKGGEYAARGARADASVAVVEGLQGSPAFVRGGLHGSLIVPELDWLSGAARASWTAVSSPDVPFYQQSSLGGAFLLRGFTEDRFIDQQAWTVELEQRIRLLRTDIFGVVADWRVDPFVTAGQVFGRFDDAFSHPRLAAGVGFRAFVHPNVVGRVDVAAGGEGPMVYVELGYPY